MKTNFQNKERGSVLAFTLVSLGILGIGLASYLGLVRAQYRSVARSQAWNEAMPVAESGVEEALTQLHYGGTNIPGPNWVASTNRIFTKTASVGIAGSYYKVKLQLTNDPVITSVGYTLVPGTTNQYIARNLQVNAKKGKSLAGGLTARGKIGFSGGAFLDSFDSSDTNYSGTNGTYLATKRKDNGLAVSNSGVAGAISASGGGIYGTAITGPGGTITTSGSAKVGDLSWWASGSSGVQAGKTSADANVDFETIIAPYNSGLPVIPGIVGTTNYTYLVTTGNYYQNGNLTIPGGGKLAVAGDAVLYVDGDFTTSGSGFVYMYPGSTLKLYVSGKFTVSGGGVMNSTLKASALTVYGVNTSTLAWTYSGSAAFIGTVYAPNSDFTFSGGAGASGAFTANNVTISGSAGVHYDEDLVANRRGYVVTSWNEI